MRSLAFSAFLVVVIALELHAQQKAVVYIYQTPHARMMKRAAPEVYCDGKLTAEIDGGRYFALALEPGTHSFHSKNKKNGGVELELKGGETYYLRVEMEHTGYFLKFSGISSAPKEQGAFTVKQMRPINERYIKDRSLVDMSVTEQAMQKKRKESSMP